MTHIPYQQVLGIFQQICQVPRPSTKGDQIRAFLQQFAKNHHLYFDTDAAGNVRIVKKGTLPSIALQAHMDMVCEKNSNCKHNFEKDPIETYEEEGWLKAKGTTLGADNGIGMAMALCALQSDCPRQIEGIFTADEEIGLLGAGAMQAGFIESPQLLNLDSEEDNEFIIGCSGGCETIANFALNMTPTPLHTIAIKLHISGLQGGHSGSDIHLHRANAIKCLAVFLEGAAKQYPLQLASIEGGNLTNAIPREASATIVIPFESKEQLRIDWNIFSAHMEDSWKTYEPDLHLDLSSCATPDMVIGTELSARIINTLVAIPHGVLAPRPLNNQCVVTSNNLASLKIKDKVLIVNTSQRSSIETELDKLAFELYTQFEKVGATACICNRYCGWEPKEDSNLLAIAKKHYQALFGEDPAIKVIHAGLECGLLRKTFPNLDMLSFGPTMRDVHSPSERLNIASVEKIWSLVEALLG